MMAGIASRPAPRKVVKVPLGLAKASHGGSARHPPPTASRRRLTGRSVSKSALSLPIGQQFINPARGQWREHFVMRGSWLMSESRDLSVGHWSRTDPSRELVLVAAPPQAKFAGEPPPPRSAWAVFLSIRPGRRGGARGRRRGRGRIGLGASRAGGRSRRAGERNQVAGPNRQIAQSSPRRDRGRQIA